MRRARPPRRRYRRSGTQSDRVLVGSRPGVRFCRASSAVAPIESFRVSWSTRGGNFLAASAGQAGGLSDLLLVEGLRFQESLSESVELVAVEGQQPIGFAVTLLNDAANLGINELGGC